MPFPYDDKFDKVLKDIAFEKLTKSNSLLEKNTTASEDANTMADEFVTTESFSAWNNS